MIRLLPAAIVASILLGPTNVAAAQHSPIVRVTTTPSEVSIGEPITLQVTVLAPTWFPSPPGYPSFELANAITRLPPDSAYPTSERINGATWSGIIRRYEVHPLLAATYRMTGLTVTVTYAHPQSFRPFTVEVDIPDIEFRAVVPRGAEGLDPFLGGTDLKLERRIEGDVDALQAGDALVVHYQAMLDGMPAIFLPRLVRHGETPGLSLYEDEPIIEDMPGGSGRVRRSERVTMVFKSGGDFAVPGFELKWWNTRTHEIETASVPSVTVSVAGPVSPADATATAVTDSRSFKMISLIAGLTLTAMLLVKWAPLLRRRGHIWQARREQSEGSAFTRLRRALREGDPGSVHRAWLVWLARLEPGIAPRLFVSRYGDVDMQAQTENLYRALYAGTAQALDLQPLAKSLAAARRNYRRRRPDIQAVALPGLNP